MRFLIAITGLAAWLLSAAPSPAQNCGVVRQRVIHQQHVVHAAHVAVVQPAVIATFAAVPVAVPHYSVGYDPHGGELAELRKAVRELSKTVLDLRAAEPVAAPRRDVPTDDVSGKAWQVLSKHCASCHTGAQAKGKVTIFSEPGKPNPSADLFLLWEAADAGRMPKGAAPINDDEARALRELVALTAKQRRAAQK